MIRNCAGDTNLDLVMFPLLVCVIIIGDVCALPIMVRRLHDMNLSGWWLVLNILVCGMPLLSKIMFFVKLLLLCSIPGVKHPNDYDVV